MRLILRLSLNIVNLKLLFIAILCILNTAVYLQKIKDCSQLSALINFDEILRNFKLSGHPDSLILIDRNGVIKKDCQSINWGNCSLRINHDSTNVMRAIKGSSSMHFKDECQYFVFDSFRKKGKSYYFTIFRACHNEFIDCQVTEIKNQFKLTWFTGGVYWLK